MFDMFPPEKKVAVDVDSETAKVVVAMVMNELSNEYYRLSEEIDMSLENLERLYNYLPKTEDFNIVKAIERELPNVMSKISEKLSEVLAEYREEVNKKGEDVKVASRHIILRALLQIVSMLLKTEAEYLGKAVFEGTTVHLGGVEHD